jgi:DNA-binding response OmpR family regulator
VTEEVPYHERGNSFRKDNKKILIVDDDETILHLLRKFFVARGFHILTARDGFVAMDQLKAENPDWVLTDLDMRLLSGSEAFRPQGGASG